MCIRRAPKKEEFSKTINFTQFHANKPQALKAHKNGGNKKQRKTRKFAKKPHKNQLLRAHIHIESSH